MKKILTGLGGIVLAGVMGISAFAAVNGNSEYFKDVTADNYGWAAEYIDYIAKNNIASGIGNDMYAPGSNIIRGDFAILVDKTFDFRNGVLDVYGFKDVPENAYYAQAIADCCTEKVITDHGMFYPDNDITRIDAFTMLYRALVNTKNVNNLSTDVSMFKDGNTLTGIEQKTAAATLYKIGIITGNEKDELNPNATMTRAEMAVVFAKLDKYVDEFKTVEDERLTQKKEEDEQKEAVKEEEKKETAKAEESKNYKGAEIEDPISVSNGGSSEIIDSSISVSDSAAVSVDNSSKVLLENTNVNATNGNGVEAKNDASASIKGGKVTVDHGTGVMSGDKGDITVSDATLSTKSYENTYAAAANGGKLAISDTAINAFKNAPAVLVANGGELNLKDSDISAETGSGKGSRYGAIDIKSKDNSKHSEINLEGTVIDNKSGGAFYVRESDVTINIKGKDNKFNTSSFINSPYIANEKQKEGNKIELNLTDGAELQEANFILDSKTELSINVGDECRLDASFEDPTSGSVNLFVADDGDLELHSDMYVEAFDYETGLVFDRIVDNGFNIYYNTHNSANEWLTGNTYTLTFGGMLIPVEGESR